MISLYSLILTVFIFTSCSTLAPVTNQYEKAGTLQRGNVEVSGNISKYVYSANEGAEDMNKNFGFKIGYGLTDKVDLKLRYEHLLPGDKLKQDIKRTNYISFIPKFSVAGGRMALLFPTSYYESQPGTIEDDNTVDMFSFAPQMLYTITSRKNKTDLTFGMKGDITLAAGIPSFFMGTTLGAGFSNNLDRWAVRPELGITFFPSFEGKIVSYGIGFQYVVPSFKRKK
jgi:hypothetical protein